ncbi:MAG: efflux RND transporter periplasmic adaptor subunit, partial [Aquabacterium sp.]|nr:efflux RND transporter periplasmic adaptor subunit [Aquabacterium sp.]
MAGALLAIGTARAADTPTPQPAASSARPALTVTTVVPQRIDWPQRLSAAGNIAAWQEVVIGSELAGLRLVEVVAQVGDRVRRGQLLARLSTDMINAELAQTRAGLAEAQALLAEAQANADRARELQPSGMISSQQAQQAITAEQAARARLASLQARLQADELRLTQTRIVAPDDGVISARVATEGAMAQPGQELFRLIRRGRLEWRAEVAAADLARLEPGTPAAVRTPSGVTLEGTVRQVAPTVDTQTRNGLVYVDLARPGDAKPGMFVRGEFSFGRSPALTLPQTAVL